jgi:flagellar hook capping protein FlgD
VWTLSLAGSPAWSEITPAGSPPSGRWAHTAIYDPLRDRMVVFGGYYDGVGGNDVWGLSLAGSPAWSELTPAGSPPTGRGGHAAIYDPLRDRMVVFGGSDFDYLNDVWALALAGIPAWSELAPAGSPPSARFQPIVIYDPARDRMVLFGGADGVNSFYDVWALSLAGSPVWSELTPAGSPPVYHPTAIYDPVRDRMVLFGGYDGVDHNDVWALSLAGSPAWSALAPAESPPSGRWAHTAIYDQVRDRMVVFGGLHSGVLLHSDVWALSWAPPVSVAQDAPGRLHLGTPRPNPSLGETTVDFDLVEPARVVLEVYDVNGRRVNRIADGWFPVGRHVSTWRGDDERGHVLVSGVYFIRMQVSGFQATRRTVRVR